MKLNYLQEQQLFSYHRLNAANPHEAAQRLYTHASRHGYDSFHDGTPITTGTAFTRLSRLDLTHRTHAGGCPYFHAARAIA